MTAPIPPGADPICRLDPELFFTESQSAAAKEMCSICFFRQSCLEYSLGYSVAGVWGGTDEEDRKRIRDRMGIVPKPLTTNPYPRQARVA